MEQPQLAEERAHSHKPFWYWLAAGLAIVVLVVLLFKNGNGDYQTVRAEYRDLKHYVDFSGTVVPAEKVNLAFEVTGVISDLPYLVGEDVIRGQVIARQNTSAEEARIRSAEADLAAYDAALRALERGTRPEEITVQETKVSNGEKRLSDSLLVLEDTIDSAFTSADNAIYNDVDQLFDNPRSTNPDLIFQTDFQKETNIEGERALLENLISNWENSLIILSGEDHIQESYDLALANTMRIKTFLASVASAVNGLTPSYQYSQTKIDGWKSDISGARVSVDNSITALISKYNAYNTARYDVALLEEELELLLSGSTDEEVDQARANVRKAEALLDQYTSDRDKKVLRTPITGILSALDLEEGEVAQANTPFVSIISDGQFEIDADVSELDVAGVLQGSEADITFDAFGDTIVYKGVVTHVDPAETLIGNIPSYGVTLRLTDEDSKVRSGLSANVSVVAEERTNVLAVPLAVIQFDEQDNPFVMVLENGVMLRKEVTLGLQGSDRFVEILSGLKEGDEIITN